MTPERAAELLPIIQAYAEGKTIQFSHKDGVWRDCQKPHYFEDNTAEYRIKPEPKVIYVNEYPSGGFATFITEDNARCNAAKNPRDFVRVAVRYIEASD